MITAQLGLITRIQALQLGETAASIKAKLASMEWVRVSHGIYRVCIYPVSEEQSLLALCLRSPGKTWISHGAAAWLHGLHGRLRDPISITTTGRLTSAPDTLVHHTSSLPACDKTIVRSVPATAVEKTLIDFAAEASEADLDFAIDEALVTRKTSLPKLSWRLRRAGGQGRPGSAALRRCIEARERRGQVDSQLEAQFFGLLKEARVPQPRLQFPIRVGSRTFLADFAFPEHKLIIEVMGYRWHGGRNRWEQDLARSSELGALGWRIIYVTKTQIRHDRIATIQRIRRALGMEPLFVL